MDLIVGVDKLTPTAEKMRRLMHYGQMFQSHALHFFHLASPDLLFGFDADPAIRNVIGVAAEHPELAVQGVMMRKFGQEIIKATAGKKIHGTGAIPGGINKNLSHRRARRLRSRTSTRCSTWARGALELAQATTRVEHLEELAGVRLVRLEPPVARPRGRRHGPLPRQPAGDRRRGREDLRPGRLPRTTSTTSPRRSGPGRT